MFTPACTVRCCGCSRNPPELRSAGGMSCRPSCCSCRPAPSRPTTTGVQPCAPLTQTLSRASVRAGRGRARWRTASWLPFRHGRVAPAALIHALVELRVMGCRAQGVSPGLAEELCERGGISPQLQPADLSESDWAALAEQWRRWLQVHAAGDFVATLSGPSERLSVLGDRAESAPASVHAIVDALYGSIQVGLLGHAVTRWLCVCVPWASHVARLAPPGGG